MNTFFDQNPYPSGLGKSFFQKIGEKIIYFFPGEIQTMIQTIAKKIWFVWDIYGAWILLILICIFVIWFVCHMARKKQRNIEKVWHILTYFLTKRQMMLPIAYTLSKRGNFLPETTLREILFLREEGGAISLKKNPHERLKQEQKVTRLLYDFFTFLEKENKILPHSRMEKFMRDCQFIHEKLQELQKVYNTAAFHWNKTYDVWPILIFAKIFGFQKFHLLSKSLS